MNVTTFWPSLFTLIDVGTAFFTNLTPCFYMYSPTLFAICWSKPLKNIERTITVTGILNPFKNPAHYNAIYDAPTTSVLPGLFFSQNISSDVIECYLAPGISG